MVRKSEAFSAEGPSSWADRKVRILRQPNLGLVKLLQATCNLDFGHVEFLRSFRIGAVARLALLKSVLSWTTSPILLGAVNVETGGTVAIPLKKLRSASANPFQVLVWTTCWICTTRLLASCLLEKSPVRSWATWVALQLIGVVVTWLISLRGPKLVKVVGVPKMAAS